MALATTTGRLTEARAAVEEEEREKEEEEEEEGQFPREEGKSLSNDGMKQGVGRGERRKNGVRITLYTLN